MYCTVNSSSIAIYVKMRCIYSHKQKYKNSQSTDDFYVNSVNTLTKFIYNTILTDKLEFLVILKVQRPLPLRIVFSIRTSNWLSGSSCERINKMLYRFFSIIHSNYLFAVFIHVILMWGMPSINPILYNYTVAVGGGPCMI